MSRSGGDLCGGRVQTRATGVVAGLVMALVAAACMPAWPGAPGGGAPPAAGTVLWEDQFNWLDSGQWAVEHSNYGAGNYEQQCYRPENVSVVDGKLVLRAKQESYVCPGGGQYSYTSGMVRSQSARLSPGQALEFRVKLTPADPARQRGLWPAVWTSDWAGDWPDGGELDFLEVITAENPKRALFSMHFADSFGGHGLRNFGVVGEQNFSADWHTVRFDYGYGGVLVWYLDGREAFRVENANTREGWPAPFDRTLAEIKISFGLGGIPGPLNPAAVGWQGATFEVDWMRIVAL